MKHDIESMCDYVHMYRYVYFYQCFEKNPDDSGYVKMRQYGVFSYFEYVIFLPCLLFSRLSAGFASLYFKCKF